MSITQNVVGRKLHYNNFNLNHTNDLSGRIGKLIPVQATPVVAGDLFDESIEFNIRMAPLSAPAMARFNVHFHSFYVPYRIITPRDGQESTWERFVMSVGKPLTEVPKLPYFTTREAALVDDLDGNLNIAKENFMTGSLWDYLHLPVIPRPYADDAFVELSERTLGVPGIVALNFLAYQKIWSDWYRRDQIEKELVFPNNLEQIYIDSLLDTHCKYPEMPANLQDEQFDIADFVNDLMQLRTRNYERDYFTSALPEPQFGDDVTLGGADVMQGLVGARIALNSINASGVLSTDYQGGTNYFLGLSDTTSARTQNVTLGSVVHNINEGTAPDFSPLKNSTEFSFVGGGSTDITSVEGATAVPQFTINELRLAMQLQGVRESINRGGTRYLEIMKSVFGVSVNDLRLQRPQYLGGIKAPISIGAVLQTSSSTENSPQGKMTGQGGSVGGNRIFRTKRIFEEAGVVMTIMSITPRTGYFGGIERQYLKHDPVMYYTPAFDHLGEQETYRAELKFHMASSVQNKETNDTLEDDRFFGYNPMYQEYKSAYSTVSGEFRNTLDNWNVFRTFEQIPVLSPEFIHAEPDDFDRIFMFENVENTSNEHFYAQLYFDIKAKRPMSKYSTPVTLF